MYRNERYDIVVCYMDDSYPDMINSCSLYFYRVIHVTFQNMHMTSGGHFGIQLNVVHLV